ncbi:MAG TPA: metallophosphoesterase [Candidatus Limnocylindrales bacterium]|nr:metallophosphoesterase [Candidatus Limnocylindrales bacterium]
MGPTRGAKGFAWLLFLTYLLIVFLAANSSAQESPAKLPVHDKTTPNPAKKESTDTYTLVGAGDIVGCADISGAEATAKLIDAIPGTVFAAGDLAYQLGTYEEFTNCYGPTWGRFKSRTRPAPGNHEYKGSGATGYFRFWDGVAGDPKKGYYSYELGSWHIIVLNTNCSAAQLGGCAEGSPEETWLKQDLAAHPNVCTLAYGHHALFSSGLFPKHAEHPELQAFWQDLYDAHADLALAGHEHSYERFAPQNPQGNPDAAHGIREIVVGTGGMSHTPLGYAKPNSEVRDDKTFGVLKLTLSPGKYRWEFIPIPGKSFRDSGEGVCHNSTIQPNN